MRSLWLLSLIAASGMAAEVLPYLDVDGYRYESVKWGPVNQGKVVIFHSRGSATIPVEKLPAEYRARFGYKPETTPAPVESPQQTLQRMRAPQMAPIPETGSDWAAYNRDRATLLLLDGKLVEKSTLQSLTGFLAKEKTELRSLASVDGDNPQRLRGALLELAQRREDAGPANPAMELRPAFWKRTGEFVLLANYDAQAIVGVLLRVYGVEEQPFEGQRVFRVATEPSFEQWQALKRR